jgi:hypothetical protein
MHTKMIGITQLGVHMKFYSRAKSGNACRATAYLETTMKGSEVPKKPSLLASFTPRKAAQNRSRVLVCDSARSSSVPLSSERQRHGLRITERKFKRST